MKGTNIQSFTEMIHNQNSPQDLCHSQWRFFCCCFLLLNMFYNQLFVLCPLPSEPFIILSEKGIRMKTIIAAISLIYNCHSLLWLDQKSTSLIAGLLRPFVTSKILLLPNNCSVKFKFTRKGGKKPREAPGFSPSTVLHQLWSGLGTFFWK